jgi:hypothetical protein
MKKSLAACFLLMLATFANGFQTPTAEWVKYTSVEGRYSILFPQQPELATAEYEIAKDEKVPRYEADVADPNGLYETNYYDIPPRPGRIFSLEEWRDRAVENSKGTLISSVAISLEGYPGIEFKMSFKPRDTDLILLTRVYNVGGRVYRLFHLFPKSSDNSSMTEKTAKFFDSFKLVTSK